MLNFIVHNFTLVLSLCFEQLRVYLNSTMFIIGTGLSPVPIIVLLYLTFPLKSFSISLTGAIPLKKMTRLLLVIDNTPSGKRGINHDLL